jgi:hypothetical protein
MALNDFDLPASYISTLEQQSSFNDAIKTLSLVGLVLALLLTLLPEFLQDAVLEGNVNGVIGPILLLLAILSNVSVALPIAVVAVIIGLVLLREFIMTKKRMRVKKINTPIIRPMEEELGDDLALLDVHKKPIQEDDNISADMKVKKDESERRWNVSRHAMVIPVEVEDRTGIVENFVVGDADPMPVMISDI